MGVRIREGQDNNEHIERRLRYELERASALGPAPHEAAFERARRRYRRHQLTIRAGVAVAVAAMLALAVLVPGRVLADRSPAAAPPASRRTTTPGTQAPPFINQEMQLRANPRQGPPGTRINVSGTGCSAAQGTPKIIVTLTKYRPDGSSYSLAYDRVSPRPDGSWHGTLIVPPRTPPGSYPLESHCVVGRVGYLNNNPVRFRVTSS
jgi:hypothetical protein